MKFNNYKIGYKVVQIDVNSKTKFYSFNQNNRKENSSLVYEIDKKTKPNYSIQGDLCLFKTKKECIEFMNSFRRLLLFNFCIIKVKYKPVKRGSVYCRDSKRSLNYPIGEKIDETEYIKDTYSNTIFANVIISIKSYKIKDRK